MANNKLTRKQEDQLQFAKGILWCKDGNVIESNIAYDSKFLDGYAYQYELEAKQSGLNIINLRYQ